MPRAKQKSDVGTAMARLNDAQFGLASDAPIIAGFESAEEWQKRHEALIADYAPVGGLETMLVERAATLLWRLKRLARYESEYSAASIERVPEDFRRRPLTRALPRTIQDANERVETLERGLRLLEGLAGATPSTEIFDDDVDAIFEALIDDDPAAAKLLEAPVPGFEGGIAGVGGWTAPGLRVAFKELAGRWGVKRRDLIAHTVERVRAMLAVRAEERAAMLAEQDRMRRERLLPEASTLHALTRYESSLHRQLMQVMHELEAAQARRRGQATPLLRADIQLVAAK